MLVCLIRAHFALDDDALGELENLFLLPGDVPGDVSSSAHFLESSTSFVLDPGFFSSMKRCRRCGVIVGIGMAVFSSLYHVDRPRRVVVLQPQPQHGYLLAVGL